MSSWIQIVTDRAVISQILCVAAIHACSKRSVADRATNLALTPPPLTAEDKEIKHATKAAQPPPEPWRPWYRRVLSRKTGMAFLPLICIIGGEFFVFWILPKITSTTVISAIWTCFVVFLIQSFMNNVLYFFLGGPVKASFGRTEKEKALYRKYDTATPDAKPFFYTKRNRTVLAFILSAALAAYTYHDKQNYALAVGAGMMTIAIFTSISFIKINSKVLTVASIGCLAMCAVIGSIVYGASAYFKSNPSSEPVDKKDPTIFMPDWIAPMMGIINDMITVIPFGFLVMMSLRYDHFGPDSAPQLGQDKGAPGEALVVPASIPSRRSPMYKIALASTIASFAFSNFIVHYLISIDKLTVKKDGRDVSGEREELWNVIKLFAFATCNMVVPAALALGAWMRGDFASWWGYHEEWVPKEEDDDAQEQAEINDAEKLLLVDAEKGVVPVGQA